MLIVGRRAEKASGFGPVARLFVGSSIGKPTHSTFQVRLLDGAATQDAKQWARTTLSVLFSSSLTFLLGQAIGARSK